MRWPELSACLPVCPCELPKRDKRDLHCSALLFSSLREPCLVVDLLADSLADLLAESDE
jgi:hypothetical protein